MEKNFQLASRKFWQTIRRLRAWLRRHSAGGGLLSLTGVIALKEPLNLINVGHFKWKSGALADWCGGSHLVCSHCLVYMCFVDLEKANIRVTLLWAIQSLYNYSESLVCMLNTNSNMFSVGVGFHQGCHLIQVLLVIFIDRIVSSSRTIRHTYYT